MSEPELVFLHIPKTAGTSLRRSLNLHCGRNKVFWFGDDCPPGIRTWPNEISRGISVVGGHKPYRFYPRNLDCLYTAVVRDPIERAISLFTFYTQPDLARLPHEREERSRALQSMMSKGIDPGSMKRSIDRCRPFRKEISDNQCAYLGRGSRTFDAVLESIREHDFIIGSMSQYAEFHRQLGIIFGWFEEPAARINRSAENYADEYLQDDELLATLRELNQEDIKLVEYVERQPDGVVVSIADPVKHSQRVARIRSDCTQAKPSVMSPDWLAQGEKFWPRGYGCNLLFPLSHVIASKKLGLFYSGIPGPTNDRVVEMFRQCSELPHAEKARELGFGDVLREFNTGIMLKDRPLEQARELIADESFYRFAIIRDPVERLVDVYRTKFLSDRLESGNKAYARGCVSACQNRERPDYERGVSFRQFVHYIVSVGPEEQRGECMPQHLFLRGVEKYHRLYRETELAELGTELARRCGIDAHLVSGGGGDTAGGQNPETDFQAEGVWADTVAGDLPQGDIDWMKMLLDDELRDLIARHYVEDYALLEQICE